jgi:hypothetical protein
MREKDLCNKLEYLMRRESQAHMIVSRCDDLRLSLRANRFSGGWIATR